MRIKVLIAKVGLDGHDRGAKIVARVLRDAGMEVVYTGLHQTPEQIVSASIQEDVDILGISILSGAHMTLIPRIMGLLNERGASEMIVVVGGVIQPHDHDRLLSVGVKQIFDADADSSTLVAAIAHLIKEREPTNKNPSGENPHSA